jgi:hypothetical protein
MKALGLSHYFNPIYVLVAGVLGGAIIFSLFTPYFPLHCQVGTISFYCVPEFFLVFFLMTILWCMVTILFLPGCGMFFWLFKRTMAEKDKRHQSYEISKLLGIALLIALSSFIVTESLNQFYPEAQGQWNADVPIGIQQIININSTLLFLVFLPYLLGMYLIYSVVRNISLKIQDVEQFKKSQSFDVINDLMVYRKMLQVFLIISGALLSMIPLIVIAIRSDLIVAFPGFESIFPVTYVIFGGLTFTLILLFIYVPAYLELSIVGQQVRDTLCPLESIDTLKDTIEKRKVLDNLLQTEINFTANLKSSVPALGPLISSLLVLLGIKL